MDTRSTHKTRKLRAKLTLRGFTYSGFAAAHGYNERTVKAAVRGERSGPLTRKVAAHIACL